MKVVLALRVPMRAAARIGALSRRVVGSSLLAGLTAIVTGCGGGAVAPVQPPAGPAIPGPERGYVVGKGDTLYSIAWRHGMDYRVLAGANSIREPYTIYPGQRLLLPGPGEIAPPEAEPGEAVPAETEVGEVVPPRRDRDAAAAGTAAAGAVSIVGAGTTATPVVTPLPESDPSTKPPDPTPAKLPDPSPAKPPPVTKPAVAPPPATRSVAGLQWTRPTGGKTISTFGRGGNNGIDIEGVFEQPIHAAAGGRVVYAGSGLIGYGKLVIVKHSSRLLSAYAHNERLHVGEGDDVKGGQRIADMGRSGKGRVMLHFEIRRDGRPVDPLRFIP